MAWHFMRRRVMCRFGRLEPRFVGVVLQEYLFADSGCVLDISVFKDFASGEDVLQITRAHHFAVRLLGRSILAVFVQLFDALVVGQRVHTAFQEAGSCV